MTSPTHSSKPPERASAAPPRVRRMRWSALIFLLLASPNVPAQERETVANFAAGRVMIYVARDGIVVGALENRIEPETRPPVVVPLSERRAAVLLGAIEWMDPSSPEGSVRLDRELVKATGQIAAPRRLEQEHASDIEEIGLALLEPLRAAAEHLHGRLELPPEEPLLELLLVGYAPDYGPEVWSLRYRVVQEPLRGDFWRTRVLRPSYTQLYPPEKGAARTLVEVRFPPADGEPAVLDLLQHGDPRLAGIRAADPKTRNAAERLLRGDSHKTPLGDAIDFMRGALGAVATPDLPETLAAIWEDRGFEWILQPPGALRQAEETKPREPGAPTLRRKPQ